MKKIIFSIFILSTQLLLANVSLDNFINEQLKVEANILDQNISLDKKIDLKKKQEIEYQEFLLLYISNQESYIEEKNPYRHEINKLKLRIRNNNYLGNTNAVMRDEVLLRGYAIRNAIKNALHAMLQHTDSESKAFFKDKVNEIILKYFSKYEPFDKKKYLASDQNQTSPIIKSLNEAVQTLNYLEAVGKTFSAEVVSNSSNIYRTAKLSNSKFFSIINTINTSSLGQKINHYLSPLQLDIAQIVLILSVILFILLVQVVIRFIVNRFLSHHAIKTDEIDYIHSHITRLFNTMTTLVIIHLILVVFLGIDSKVISISKIFAIIYVLLAALLLYRITNTIAYIKMEGIKNSKVLKNEVVNLTIKTIDVLIIIVATIAILKIIGVNLTALLSGLGIFGAAVAFAAKDSIANIFGSLSILAGDVFEQGDWIETKDVNGTVVEIGLRATTIRTFDNALISIPNSELANFGVKNWSRRSIGRRIKMTIGVTYESDFDDIRKAIDEIKEILKMHPGIANERTEYQNIYRQSKLVSAEDYKGVKRTTLVYMDEFSDSSINILVYCFSRTVVWNEWLEVKEDVMFKIADILAKNHLEFAYPTLMLHQTKDDKDEIE